MACTRSFPLTDLSMYPSAPILMAEVTRSLSSDSETAIILVGEPDPLIASMTLKASAVFLRSRIRMSGQSSDANLTASLKTSASPTTSICSCSDRCSERPFLKKVSLSTIPTRILLPNAGSVGSCRGNAPLTQSREDDDRICKGRISEQSPTPATCLRSALRQLYGADRRGHMPILNSPSHVQ